MDPKAVIDRAQSSCSSYPGLASSTNQGHRAPGPVTPPCTDLRGTHRLPPSSVLLHLRPLEALGGNCRECMPWFHRAIVHHLALRYEEAANAPILKQPLVPHEAVPLAVWYRCCRKPQLLLHGHSLFCHDSFVTMRKKYNKKDTLSIRNQKYSLTKRRKKIDS